MKKKLATVWLGGCSGCHMSLLDIDERILEVAKLADIVKSPVVDGKEFPECDIALVEGALANAEHEEEIQVIRRKAKVLVAFGDCAVTGNVSALRNAIPKEVVLKRSYLEVPGTVGGLIPNQEIAPLIDRVRPLHEAVKVDYYLPGCPPPADRIKSLVGQMLSGVEPKLEGVDLKFG